MADYAAAFESLTTPHIADGCLRASVAIRQAPAGLACATPKGRCAGRVLPVRHYGSVDVFLEAFEMGRAGDVLVIDNGGRMDEACAGDLTVLEAQAAGMRGVLIWGAHRDGPELQRIAVPVFSYGTVPSGPRRLDAQGWDGLRSAGFGSGVSVTSGDVVFADADGAIFVPASKVEAVIAAAKKIAEIERGQAELVRSGTTLRAQLKFTEFLAARAKDPALTFRQHLRTIGGAIEE